MFLLYINEIGKNINHSHIRLFADDCLLYREISCDKEIHIQDEIQLHRDINSLQDFSQTLQSPETEYPVQGPNWRDSFASAGPCHSPAANHQELSRQVHYPNQ